MRKVAKVSFLKGRSPGAWSTLALLVTGLVLVALVVGGCAPAAEKPAPKPAAPEQPKYGGMLLTTTAGDPPSFDLTQESTYMTCSVASPAYNNLVQLDPMDQAKIIPELAERWEQSADGLTWTFYLKKGVKFHDGQPFTSADAKFSLERVQKPPKGTVSPRSGAFKPVTSFAAPDDYTLVIKLERPYPSFLPNMAQGWMVMFPKHVLEAKGDMKRDMVGTGPFKFKSYMAGSAVEMVKNEDYHIKGRPYADGVTNYIIKEPAARMAALKTEKINLHFSSPTVELPDAVILKRDYPRIVLQEHPSIMGFLTVNMNAKIKPWDDVRVRQAVNLVIDRKAAIEFVHKGIGVVGGFLPTFGEWSIPLDELNKMPGYRYPKDPDIAEAKRLLAQAGYPTGFKTSLLTRAGAGMFEDISTFMKDQMAKIGIDAAIDVQETATTYDRLRKGDYEVCPYVHGLALDDPDHFFAEFFITGAPRKYTYVDDPKIDELFEKQSRELDKAKRKQLVIEMQKQAMQSLPKIMMTYPIQYTAHWDYVRDYKAHWSLYNNCRLQDVWLAK